jgi:glycosyltransferase involved in cell wall biosynthesis
MNAMTPYRLTPVDELGPRPSTGTSTARPSVRPSVCFVAPNAYGALSGSGTVGRGGGAERQQVLVAEELVRRGYRVSFVVLDHGQPDAEEIGGIRTFKCYRVHRGIRGLRFFHPRLTGLWSAMARANADVYYQRGAGSETGLVALWCRGRARGFIFAVANETTCLHVSPFLTRRLDRILFRYGLRRAAAVIAQTLRQQGLLLETFGIASTVIRSVCGWRPEELDPTDDDRPPHVLWAGRLSPEKRPEWVIRLARDLPNHWFDVVGQCDITSAYGRTLVNQLESLPNLHWHGYIQHPGLQALYRRAWLLLCTSESEGFPNVFLEAWSSGRPVLTTVDPDDVVATFQLGEVAVDYATMKEHLGGLPARRATWNAAGRRGQDYVRQHHDAAAAGDALEAVIRRCHDTVRGGSR